ncbi:MAG: TlpA family protein disulfide reductase [Bacteroidia bacterium]|nr:TlpA family protein disulfide reductase [Bacteroidia bacterium]
MNKLIALFLIAIYSLSLSAQGLEITDQTKFKDLEGNEISLSQFQEFIATGDYTIDPVMDSEGNAVEIRLIVLTKEDKIMQSRVVDIKSEAEDKPVIPFEVSDMNGKIYSSQGQLGRVTAIKFWFKECKPCIEEMPKLNQLVAEYAGNDEVDFLAFGLDNADQIRTFVENTSFDYTLIPNAEKVRSDMKIIGFPTHIVVNKEGVVTEFIQGGHLYIDRELRNAIDEALGNKTPDLISGAVSDENVGFVIDPQTTIKDEVGNEIDFDTFMKLMETGDYVPHQTQTSSGKTYIILKKKT